MPSDAVPKDPQQAYEEVKRNFAAEGMAAFPPTPFTSSNEVAVTATTAAKLGLRNISDLAGKAKKLVLAGAPECRERLDCLAGLEQVYGLWAKELPPVTSGPRRRAAASASTASPGSSRSTACRSSSSCRSRSAGATRCSARAAPTSR